MNLASEKRREARLPWFPLAGCKHVLINRMKLDSTNDVKPTLNWDNAAVSKRFITQFHVSRWIRKDVGITRDELLVTRHYPLTEPFHRPK